LPAGVHFAFVGVDAGGAVPGREIGQWEEHEREGVKFWFMPVVRLDPADQHRKIPHSLRLVFGVVRYRRRLPAAKWFQAHRMDTAWSLRRLVGQQAAYFIHTQENGLTGEVSDSFWRLAGTVHKRLERSVVKRARQVVVFNEDYAEIVRQWNPRAQSSTTWFDPDLIVHADEAARDPYQIVWVGRLEVPKDPALAVSTIEALAAMAPEEPWRLDLVGSGTLLQSVTQSVADMPEHVRRRVSVHGRVAPDRVAQLMARASVFLMTSHPGYEGYPRVLVEALASGLPSVVTDGSDTGRLVRAGENGFVTNRDPHEIAMRIRAASKLPRTHATESVTRLGAPAVIADIYASAGGM
jgi:glycosyltransferase involved in cell wall biosynthesis